MAPVKSLAEIASSVRYGYTASATDKPIGPHFLRITDIVRPQINWDTVPYCEIDDTTRHRFSLANGDIVIARTGATVGSAKLIRRSDPDAVFASYLVRIRIDPEQADPAYVGRIVESDVYKRFVQSRVSGAAQPNANAKVLSAFCLPIPDHGTQSRIASILATYDDLIKNNRRRIQLLERAARLLYREWFVHLRFPGHEHVAIPNNGVPEGWKRGVVSDYYNSTSGGTPSRKHKEYFQGSINWVKTKELDERFVVATEERITEQAISQSAAKLLPAGTLLVSIYGGTNIGRTAILGTEAACNQACVAFFSKRRQEDVLLLQKWVQHNRNFLIGLAQGAAQTNISQATLRRLEFLMPAEPILEEYLDVTSAMGKQILNLVKQNRKLTQARDLLLPRLMNGEISV